MKRENRENCCGACCWFLHEDTDGWGLCPHQDKPIGSPMHCSDLCTTDEFVSETTKRHYMAVLIQANRYRRDNNVPSLYRMPNPKELGKAIDFSVKYMKLL